MSRALATFGVGPHEALLDIALPSFEEFAERHGYDLTVAHPRVEGRAASWFKIPLLHNLLAIHDEVLWLDADVVVVDPSEDIAAALPGGFWQALAEHHSAVDGNHPNCGVWLVRRPMRSLLARIWGMTSFLHHPWWEQAAILDLMGYETTRPVRHVSSTCLWYRTGLLGEEWNALPGADVAYPRFRHSASRLDRAQLMRGWAADAQPVG